VAALCREIRSFSSPGIDIDTIYLGGGTPSLLSPPQLRSILVQIGEVFDISGDAETTMEMNPATVTPESLLAYRQSGVNRASFGVQTFNELDLKLLARGHDANDARNTFRMLREAGFDNVSLDLIAGLPGQSIDDWRRNLNEAVSMESEHLSLYLLEVHEGTPLAEQLRSGRRPMPDEELVAEMYEIMIDTLADAGYRQYEISNFAKPGFESRHNSKYWRMDPVYGFGVSAHSFDGRERYANDRDTNAFVDRIEKTGSAEVSRETIDFASESVFLGLRLNDGVDVESHRLRFGADLTEKVPPLKANGLVEVREGRLRLTRRGMLFSNDVFAEFI
jgi:oxygen-independent coproporphyrinogen-3 oxidase